MFVVVPIKYSVGVRHALIAPQSYDVRVHVYTYSKVPRAARLKKTRGKKRGN